MGRRRPRVPDVEENGDVEAEPDVVEGTVDDLIQEEGLEADEQVVLLRSEDIPTAADQLPIPTPVEGIRRAAVVYNLNFVYDDTAEEWVRQNPFSGGGGWTTLDSGEVTVGSSSFEFVETTVDTLNRNGAVMTPFIGIADDTTGELIIYSHTHPSLSTGDIEYVVRWDDVDGNYDIVINNEGQEAHTLTWALMEFVP